MSLRLADYDTYATEYAAYVERREQNGAEADPMGILPPLLELLGDVSGKAMLDAGCGEGFLARILAARGAHVTGIDLSPRLLQVARGKDSGHSIDFRQADLSQPLPELAEHFDVIASYLVLDDVRDYRGFAATMARSAKPGARVVMALNSPFAYVLRKHIATNYFASGDSYPSGLARSGIRVRFYYRTLSDYLDAFVAAGLHLIKLLDIDDPKIAGVRDAGGPLPEGEELPRFTLLAFEKP